MSHILARANALNVPAQMAEIINAVHRHSDGYVCFTRKEGPADMRHMFSVKASELDGWLPQILDHVLTDAYWSINAMFRPGRWPSKYVPGLMAGERASGLIRYLTAAFVDCDMHADANTQMIAALEAQRRASSTLGFHVPDWSIIQHSGRGFWLFWLLRDEAVDPDHYANVAGQGDRFQFWRRGIGAPLRTNRTGQLEACWNRCQRQLLRAFASCNADANAADLARVTRVPGSTNTKASAPVVYRVNYMSDGTLPSYTLSEFAAFLNVAPPAQSGRRKSPIDVDPKRSKEARGKRVTMLERRLSRWRRLAEIRGGYHEGCRSSALWIAGATLRMLRRTREEIVSELLTLNAQHCTPPLKSKEVEAAAAGSCRVSLLSDAKIADRLAVTPDEAKATGWPYAGHVADPSLKGNSRAVADNRRTLIVRLMREGGGELLAAEIVKSRLEAVGVFVSLRTVQLDMRRLGLESSGGPGESG